MAKHLNERQQTFIAEYLRDSNATMAYVAAGYSENGAAQSASVLLRNPKIQARIAEVQGERLEKLDITAESVFDFHLRNRSRGAQMRRLQRGAQRL